MIVCISEDRPSQLIGVQLLVLSLLRHCPGVRIHLSCPNAPQTFEEWARSVPGAEMAATKPETSGLGWNVKPDVLLECLEAGHDEVVWMDSDVLVNADFRTTFASSAPEVVVATEDSYWGQAQGWPGRTELWGLRHSRTLETVVNTAILRVTSHHVALLHAWKKLLSHPKYLCAQALPNIQRSLHMVGDQDAFTALLASQQFSAVPVRLLQRGTEIAHCYGPAGYRPSERLRSLTRGQPMFFHSMGLKPWYVDDYRAAAPSRTIPTRLRHYYDQIHLDLSPYSLVARTYQDELDRPTWIDARTVPGKAMRAVARTSPVFTELPLAMLDSVVRTFRRRLSIRRYGVDPEFALQTSPLSP